MTRNWSVHQRRRIARRDVLKAGATGAVVIGALSGPARGSGTLHVDDDNPTSDDTDGDANFATIQAAVDAARPGTTIVVAPGTYHEHVRIGTDDLTLTGRPGDPATRGPEDEAPTLDGQGRNEHAFRVGGSVTGVTIEGFEVTNYGFDTPQQSFPDGTGVRAGTQGSPATRLVVRDNYLHALGAAGVRIKDGVDCSVVRNVVRDVAGPYETTNEHPGLEFAFGITLANNANSTVADNLVAHHRPDGGTTGSSETTGIRVKAIGDGSPRSDGVRVVGNTVRGAFTVSGITVNTSPGSGSRVVADTTIEANVVSGSANSGLDTFLRGDDPEIRGLTIRDNTFRDNAAGGIFFGRAENDGRHAAVEIAGNSLQANDRVGIALPPATPVEGMRIADNEVADTRPDDGFGVGLVVATEDIFGDVHVEGNDVTDNRAGIGIPRGPVPTDRIFVNGNDIHGNDAFGLFNADGPELDAENNWWGAPNGPERAAGRSGRTVGDGDRVSDHVDFKPWRPKEH